MRIGFEFSGGEELAAMLRTLGESVRRRALLRVLRIAAEPMRQRMADLAPRGRASDTGGGIDEHLADHIGISVAAKVGSVAGGQWEATDEYQAAVAIGPTRGYFYGRYQEYGTVHHTAQPFGRPAFDGQYETALDRMRAEFWELLADAAAKRGVFTEAT